MSAILWAIGKYNALVRLIDECWTASEETFLPTLMVLRAAAKLKALDDEKQTQEEGFAKRKQLVDEVMELWNALPQEERGGYLLGVGYVLYHAWKSESRGVQVGDAKATVAEEVQEWARKSLEAGREARKALNVGGLAWSFAVNHCAYVSLVTQAASEKECEPDRRALVNLQGHPVWNSRFADTLGCYQLFSMEREWDSTSPEDRPKLDFERRFRRADEFFQEALKVDFGDIDLASHMKRLEDIKDRYEAVQPAT